MAKQKNMETEKSPERKPLRHLIFLPFRFVFRLVTAVFLVIYVLIGMSAATELYQRNFYRSQDISSLYAHIDDAAQSGDSRGVTSWLRSRPLPETDKLVEMMTPKSAPLGSDVFFEIARRQLALGRTEEALFWLELGRFRLLYDIIRCGVEPEAAKIFNPIFEHMNSQETDDLLRAHPELMKKISQRILDFDAKYPPHDNPAFICKPILSATQLPVEEINWEGYHQVLRKHVQEFLENPDKARAAVEKK